MLSPRKLLVLLLALVSLTGPLATRALAAGRQAVGSHEVRLTWLSIANWLFEIGDLRIVTDGTITRFPRENFFGPGNGLEFTFEPVTIDVQGVERVIDALGGNKKVDFILTGHSHMDHAYDVGTWAKLTGAHVIGARSTCFQVFAQGVPASQCTTVNGGETLDLGGGVTVRVIRLHHSGVPFQEPLELNVIPTPTVDPVTGNLQFRAGILEDFPNGGGGRGYLFTVNNPGAPINWVFIDTTSTVANLDRPVVVDGVNFGTPRANMIAAMAGAGLTGVDLLIQNASLAFTQESAPIFRPRAFIPNHLGDFREPFELGLQVPFSNPSLEAFLVSAGIQLVAPRQFMDAWKLDAKGITAKPNTNVKQKLGFTD